MWFEWFGMSLACPRVSTSKPTWHRCLQQTTAIVYSKRGDSYHQTSKGINFLLEILIPIQRIPKGLTQAAVVFMVPRISHSNG